MVSKWRNPPAADRRVDGKESVEARQLNTAQNTCGQQTFQPRRPIRIWPAEALTGVSARQHPVVRVAQDEAIRQLAATGPGRGVRKALREATRALAQWDATQAISQRWAMHVLLANGQRLCIPQREARSIIEAGWAEGAQWPRCVYRLATGPTEAQ